MQERFNELREKYGDAEFIRRLGEALYDLGLIGSICSEEDLQEVFNMMGRD